MSETFQTPTSRRDFLINTSRFAAASALAGVAIPAVHAAGSDMIQLALVGCGGRGTGAAADALGGPPAASDGGPRRAARGLPVFPHRPVAGAGCGHRALYRHRRALEH